MSQHPLFGVRDAVAVSASALEIAGAPARGFYCGVSGDATFTLEDGSSIQFVGIAAGVIHPIRFTHLTAFTGSSGLALF